MDLSIFRLLSRWFWLVLIGVTCLNALDFRRRANQFIKARPELEPGYRTLTKGFLLWGNLPWIIMGAGIVFGAVPSVFSYFRPRDGNPFVLAFFFIVFLEWILGTYWLLFLGGAQMVVDYPGLTNFKVESRRSVIALWFFCLTGGVIGVILIFSNTYPQSFPRLF
jgi:hypothetical protein